MGRPETMRKRRRQRRLKQLATMVAAAGVVAGLTGGAAAYVMTRHHAVLHMASAAPGPGTGGTDGSGGVTTTTAHAALAVAGVQASWVIAENQRPGTTSWQITAPSSGFISGFADHASASPGDAVDLYVSTDASSFHVEAYRMGWYGGAGARLVWTSAAAPGSVQSKCPLNRLTNMVSCDRWSESMAVTISPEFVPGDYLLKLVGSGGQQSYVPLTVHDLSSRAAYLVENDIYTWQAWNPYGGYDFYQGEGPCPAGVYPVCNRARVVSFDRPYAYGSGAADFLGNEYPLVRFAEEQGLDVTYATSADLEAHPAAILQHRALLSLGHDECWSYHERVAAQNAEQAGVNLIFFGASAVLRHVRMEDSPLGPMRQEVDYRNSGSDPLDGSGEPRQVTGNTWADPPASWSEVPFVGESYTGYLRPGYKPVGYRVYEGSSWLFAGTGLQSGDEIPGLLVSDFDQVQPGVSPENVEVLAHSPMPRGEVQSNVGNPASDTSYYTDRASGAGVFDTGTVTWIPDLDSSPVVGRMTSNLLALFGSGPVGRVQPSTGNWKSIYLNR